MCRGRKYVENIFLSIFRIQNYNKKIVFKKKKKGAERCKVAVREMRETEKGKEGKTEKVASSQRCLNFKSL